MGRYRFRPTIDPVQRFWAKVNKDGPLPEKNPELGKCWDWLGSKRKHGHGYFHVDRKPSTPYKFSYELHVGKVPEGHGVLHRCDRGCCVNPAHLFTGTQLDNMGDASKKGRVRKGDNHSSSKINSDDVIEMRELYRLGAKIKDIMAAKGLGRSIVSHVVHRTRWTHI